MKYFQVLLSIYRPISVYRLGEMPTQSCGQSVSAPRGKAGVSLNAHTELRAKRQRSAREAIYRNRPIRINLGHYTKAKIEFPELNVSGDVYRIGTLLELIREVATKLSAVGLLLTITVGSHTMIPLAFKSAPSENNKLCQGVNPPNWVGQIGFADFCRAVRREPSFLESIHGAWRN